MIRKNQYKTKNICNIVNLNYSINNFTSYINEYINKKQVFAICLINIVNFRNYNYILGYEYGDILLNMVFSKVEECIDNRSSICRFGGDKLLVIIPTNNKENLKKTIKKIIETTNFPFEIRNKKARVCINMGISIYPNDSNNVEKILKYSDIALNYSRKVTKTPYEFFEICMYENLIEKEKIITNIEYALKNKEFMLYYQPQIDINTMKVYGMEALLRWHHSDLGIIAPSYFIEIIEENGMIVEVGKFVLYEACNEIVRLHSLGYSNLSMSINISEKQLEDDLFLSFVKDILVKTGIEPKYLSFEITERILLNLTEKILNVLSSFRNIGIKIFIDDFGTKYSSLNYLNNIPLDGIKIDKSFVDKIYNFEKEFIITKNIIRLAYELNIEVVAEGVEKVEQLKCLEYINCKKMQGFLFEKPVPKNDFVDFLETFNKRDLKIRVRNTVMLKK